MNPDEYRKMYELETHYWWFVSRAEMLEFLVDQFLKRRGLSPGGTLRILDLGCGTGATLEVLARSGCAFGIDFSWTALSFCNRRSLPRLAQSRGEQLAFKDGTFDLVVAMDTLEHFPEDLAALRECSRVLKDGGGLVTSVPAFGFLWSEHDEALHHFRRFSRRELTRKLTHSGFTVGYITHTLFLLFLPVLAIRILQNFLKDSLEPSTRLVRVPEWLNRSLVAVNRFERWLLGFLTFPVGVSLAAVAFKSGGGEVR